MSKKKPQPGLLPQLRFPEFWDGNDWQKEPLGSIVSLEYGTPLPAKERSGEGFPVVGSNGVVGFHNTASVSGPAIIIGRKGSVGQISLIENDCTPIDTTFYVVPKRPEREDFKFVWRLLESTRLDRLGDAGAVPGLNRNDVYARQTAVPDSLEQRKIADCLGSLDDLIEAEDRKLTALQDHKKGLMQQLFPRENETQPQLRFPEFQDAGNWERVHLADICSIQRGKFTHRPRNDPKFFGGPYPFIQTGDVVRANGGPVTASQSLNELGLSVSKLFQPTIVLITIAANIGDTALLETEACFTDSVVGLIPQKGRATPKFLEAIVRLKRDYLNKVATTGAQKNINNEILAGLLLCLPTISEQQKIAACLSALDAQIAAQAEKLDALRNHKQGLMQQLFPKPEDQ